MNQAFTGQSMIDAMIIGSLMSLLSSQINSACNNIFNFIQVLFQLLFMSIYNLIFLIMAGKKLKTVIITDFNPVYKVLENQAFNEKNDKKWWFRIYNFIVTFKTFIISQTKKLTTNTSQNNSTKTIQLKESLKCCNESNCPICVLNPTMLYYPSNMYDAKLTETHFNFEHYKIINLINQTILTHKNSTMIFQKYNCITYSSVMVIHVYSKDYNPNLLNIIQEFLDKSKTYKDEMIYSHELHDVSIKPEKFNESRTIFGNVNHSAFLNFITSLSKNTGNNGSICKEFTKIDKVNMYIDSLNLVNVKKHQLSLLKTTTIDNYEISCKLQKMLNIGYKSYYNDDYAFTHSAGQQTILFSINEFTITIIKTYNISGGDYNFGIGIIVSKIGSVVTRKEFKKVIFKLCNMNNEFVKKGDVSINKLNNIYTLKWEKSTLGKRTLDSIYLPIELKNNIKNNIEKFMNTEKEYDQLGIVYKLGLLFYGPPGTGKTSLVKAIANYYGISIYVLDLNNSGINDENISSIINALPEPSNFKILLFEDIDTAFIDKEQLKHENKTLVSSSSVCELSSKKMDKSKENEDNKDNDSNTTNQKTNKSKETKYLTYSGLLNAFDGVDSNQTKVIMIMTTNYKEKLGKALIRPGRIDYMYCVTYCSEEQIVEMTMNVLSVFGCNLVGENNSMDDIESKIRIFASTITAMFNELNAIKNMDLGVTPARLQSYLMKYSDNIELLLSRYEELLEINE